MSNDKISAALEAAKKAVRSAIDSNPTESTFYCIGLPENCRPATKDQSEGPWKNKAHALIIQSIEKALKQNTLAVFFQSLQETKTLRSEWSKIGCRAAMVVLGIEEIASPATAKISAEEIAKKTKRGYVEVLKKKEAKKQKAVVSGTLDAAILPADSISVPEPSLQVPWAERHSEFGGRTGEDPQDKDKPPSRSNK